MKTANLGLEEGVGDEGVKKKLRAESLLSVFYVMKL